MRPPVPQIAPHAVGNHQRHEHVFQRGQFGQQVVELEDHAEVGVPQGVAGLGRKVVDPLPAVIDFALVGRVERAQQVQERALARAALPDDRQKLALADAQAHAPEHRHFDRALAVALVQVDRQQVVAPIEGSAVQGSGSGRGPVVALGN